MPLIFVYDPQISIKKKLFTVLVSERVKSAGKWSPSGPKRIYYAQDLEALRHTAADAVLFKSAIQSELEIRKREGRFHKEAALNSYG